METDLIRRIATSLCQFNRVTRDMPSEAEIQRAMPYAISLIKQVHQQPDRKLKDIGRLPNGCTLYVMENAAGGRTYYSDECAVGHEVWDTASTSESTLLAAMTYEWTQRHREAAEAQQSKGKKRG